jgi:glucose/arabinose dehydrogenase
MTPSRISGLLLALALLLGACGTDEGGDGAAGAPDDAGTTTTTAAGPGDAPGGDEAPEEDAGDADPALDDVDVVLTEVADLDDPIALATRAGHDDVLYVAERAGRVRLVGDDGGEPATLLDITDRTTTESERGLLGIAFSPDGDHLYVSHTDPAGDSVLAEYALGEGADAVDPASRRTVLQVDQPFPNHNGGHVDFGPDGHLYLGLGDGGRAGDPEGNGQDTGTLLGALLRIDPRPEGGDPYGIPPDNPFVDGGGRPEIWAYGLRNPWRFSFDAETEDLWIADVGQNEVEEVNLLPAEEGAGRGANLGWDLLEGSRPFAGDADDAADTVLPVFEYPNDADRCAVTGGHVYRGAAIPDLAGAYVWGDYCESRVHALALTGGEARTVDLDLEVAHRSLVSFGEDAAGELYVLSMDGPVLRLDPA